MTAVRETFCNLAPMEIPRPKCNGMQFVPTRGRLGFYRSIRAEGSKYGVQVKSLGPRRPLLSDDLFKRPETVKEEESESDSAATDSARSSSSQISSDSSRSSPVECEPDYPREDSGVSFMRAPPSRPVTDPPSSTSQLRKPTPAPITTKL